jgi:hypothetical protein
MDGPQNTHKKKMEKRSDKSEALGPHESPDAPQTPYQHRGTSIVSLPNELLLHITGYVDIFSARSFSVCTRALKEGFLPVSSSQQTDPGMLKGLLGPYYPVPQGVDVQRLVYSLACREVLTQVIKSNRCVALRYREKALFFSVNKINYHGDSVGLDLNTLNLFNHLQENAVIGWYTGCVGLYFFCYCFVFCSA